jgi:GTPase SAR1 family protein
MARYHCLSIWCVSTLIVCSLAERSPPSLNSSGSRRLGEQRNRAFADSSSSAGRRQGFAPRTTSGRRKQQRDEVDSNFNDEVHEDYLHDNFSFDGDNFDESELQQNGGAFGDEEYELDLSEPNSDQDDEFATDDLNFGQSTAKDALYDAYNTLHTLAQDFKKPFDAPAVIVVGHQSSGKSALIEALMGFQFNQVGGGTKTRRPVALRMQYNPECTSPRCYLQCDDGVERPKKMAEIQDYIQSENIRLARDPVRCFDSREINIRMEYKYCPNMILIDTPGLISAPKVRGQATNMQQRALLASAREAERLVVQKMRCPDYIILCVEDTSDWKHGATREIVQKADPDLSRTVIVQTKLDTKIPQFGTGADVQEFLGAEIIDSISPRKLGGPFFTSVPSGRVGRVGMNEDDSHFLDDEEFVLACAENEEKDRSIVFQKLGRVSNTSVVNKLVPRVGLSQLRGFLERKVDDQYRRNVAKIVPLLQSEHASAQKRLQVCERELEALSLDRLKSGAEKFCDEFCAELKDAIQGSIIAPPSLFGETLQQENLASGSFYGKRVWVSRSLFLVSPTIS